ncbi:hypothetical protein [Hypericibacter sp.]|uniref:hypothetical protein n=1 Tax=Hypericibacter sp. TaxID=2705401 RepID=UPI003D6D6226
MKDERLLKDDGIMNQDSTEPFMADREQGEELRAMTQDTQKTTLSTQKARSGETSGHLRIILGTSLVLVIVALGALLIFYTSHG